MGPQRVIDRDWSDKLAAQRPSLYRFAVTLSGPDDADDVVQDALARAWRKRSQFDSRQGSLRSWLLAIVADQARGRWRRRRPVEEQIRPDALRVETGHETGLDLRREVALLPPRQRAAVVLHYFVDLPVDEVAAMMACSPGTVKSTLHDARERLARTLGETYVED